MATRLWRIYMSAPSTGASGDEPHGPRTREVYLTTLTAPSADAALTKYNRAYGSVMGFGEYAIEDEDVTGSRIV